jgi:hypothetical protein
VGCAVIARVAPLVRLYPVRCHEARMTILRRSTIINNCQRLLVACAVTVMSADTKFAIGSAHLGAPNERARMIAEFNNRPTHTDVR